MVQASASDRPFGRLAALEQEARQQSRGLWAEGSALPPCRIGQRRNGQVRRTIQPFGQANHLARFGVQELRRIEIAEPLRVVPLVGNDGFTLGVVAVTASPDTGDVCRRWDARVFAHPDRLRQGWDSVGHTGQRPAACNPITADALRGAS